MLYSLSWILILSCWEKTILYSVYTQILIIEIIYLSVYVLIAVVMWHKQWRDCFTCYSSSWGFSSGTIVDLSCKTKPFMSLYSVYSIQTPLCATRVDGSTFPWECSVIVNKFICTCMYLYVYKKSFQSMEIVNWH